MDRYRVVPLPARHAFGILDRESYDYCGLPDEDGRAKPLVWVTRASAEAWLNQCYRLWAKWERDGGGIAPKDWRPLPPELSPFDRGYRFYQ